MIKRLILFLIFLLLTGCQRGAMVEESRIMMDTIVKIKVPETTKKDISIAISNSFSKMEDIERLLNRYDKNSECALINRLKLGDKIKISPQTAFVLRKALELNRITGGAFDITVSPLVDLWNSYREKNKIPPEEEIARVLAKVNSKYILLDDNNSLSFFRDGIMMDLSGIAKGYAVDEAISVLKKDGIENGLVDAGGDIYCLGAGPSKKGWRVGIRHPREKRLLGTLLLKDKAVATSGDYQKFFFVGKKRYSHILDPRSGYPISDTPMSVTVIAPDCITADGLATAISVMGPVDGLRLAEELEGIEAIVIKKDKEGIRTDITSGLEGCYEPR